MGEFNRGPRRNFGGSREQRRDFDRGPRRDFNRGPRRFNDGPVEKHKATCTKCKKECEVPFKPTPGKDVFCQECYKKIKGF